MSRRIVNNEHQTARSTWSQIDPSVWRTTKWKFTRTIFCTCTIRTVYANLFCYKKSFTKNPMVFFSKKVENYPLSYFLASFYVYHRIGVESNSEDLKSLDSPTHSTCQNNIVEISFRLHVEIIFSLCIWNKWSFCVCLHRMSDSQFIRMFYLLAVSEKVNFSKSHHT